MKFKTRKQAVRHAQRSGITSFRTFYQKTRWQYYETTGQTIEAAEIFMEQVNGDDPYINHVEEDKDGLLYAIVTCLRVEILDTIPSYINIEPITPSLWAPDTRIRGKLECEGTIIGQHIEPATGGAPAQRKRPKTGTITGRVWEIADKMTGATRNGIVQACVDENINKNTAITQYGHWLKATKI